MILRKISFIAAASLFFSTSLLAKGPSLETAIQEAQNDEKKYAKGLRTDNLENQAYDAKVIQVARELWGPKRHTPAVRVPASVPQSVIQPQKFD